jgi:DNA-binding MarR family transcriptional regulator
MARIRGLFLSKARMKIFSHLMLNGISSPGKLHEELDIPLSSVYREIKNLEKGGYIETVHQLSEGRGRPPFRAMINQSEVHHILEKISEFVRS